MTERPATPPLRTVRSTVSVLVVDDDALVRHALVGLLDASAGIEVVGEADDGSRVVAAVAVAAPDVVLMDVEMPILDGVRAAWRLSIVRPELPVVLMSADPSDELVLLALRAGAAGVLAKDLDAGELPRLLRAVAAGDAAVSRRTCRAMSDELHRRRTAATELRPIVSPLTTREWQVLQLMQAGASTPAISSQLRLSVHTVRNHVKRILVKLGVHSRASAVAWSRSAPDPGAPEFVSDPGDEERALAGALAALVHTAGPG